MERYVGTVVRGIRTPIIKEGDPLVDLVFDSIVNAVETENIAMREKDVVAVTESLLARSQGNFVSVDDIAADINEKFDADEIGVVFPILSRNRFSAILRGLAKSGKKLHILLSYPSDEVGNQLMDESLLIGKDINPYTDILSEKEYREYFGDKVAHPFTGVDYVSLYKEIAPNSEIHFSNDPKAILSFTDNVLVSSIHSRQKVTNTLKSSGAKVVYSLADLLNKPSGDSGYNEEYGLLGSNLSTEDSLKLFPRDSQSFVLALQEKFKEYTNKTIEVMVYGDGAFKDPVGQIWELADPVVSPGYTPGLEGTPNEIKIKYIADTELGEVEGSERTDRVRERIAANKENGNKDSNEGIGTTPRRITDLLGSLSDLTSGSGDKGTPVVYVQGYFDNYASE